MTRRSLPFAVALSGTALGVHAGAAQSVRYTATISRASIVSPLPLPPVAPNASPATFLREARRAVEGNRLAAAQEALERAEARLLDRSVAPAAAGVPNRQVAVLNVGVARRSLAVRDRVSALRAIDDALHALEIAPSPPPPPQTVAGGPVPLWPPTQLGPPVQPTPSAPPPVQFILPVHAGPPLPPPISYALLPGHWQLDGARYVWVPPDRIQRRAVDRALLPNQYDWRDGRWVFVPQHGAAP